MTRLARAACGAVLLLCVAAPASRAAIEFRPCSPESEAVCGNLTVPLDRGGSVPGTIKLRVAKVPAERPSGRAVFALAGGPGQGATGLAESFAFGLERARRTHDIVVFDQRGTGESGPIDCTDVDRVRDIRAAGPQIRACAQKLGAAARFYTTQDTVGDIESVRAELGYGRIGMFGVSYGTKVELAYASAFPQRVERMVLDSVVQLEGPDPLLRDSFRAVPRVLRELCRSAFCRGVTADPVADLAAAVQRMAAGPLRGSVYTEQGRRQAASIDSSLVFTLLLIGDFEPRLRTVMPGAIRSAALGDPAPLLRLAKLIEPPPNPQAPDLREFSTGLWLATVCAELPFPWDPDASESDRRRQAAERAATIDRTEFDPFAPATALGWDIISMCEHWPVARPAPAGDLSAVQAPTLLVNGRTDLRTPLENAQRMAARLPAAIVLPVAEVGHSTTSSDPTGCAGTAADDFMAGRAPATCTRRVERMKIRPLAPTRVEALTPSKGTSSKRGRTAKAVDLTVHDVLDELDLLYADRGGLRGGSFRIGERGIQLRAIVYVPGVKVSGTIDAATFQGTVRVSGSRASRGRLAIGRGGVVTGELDGRRVRFRIKLPKPPEGLGGGEGDGEEPGEPRVPTWLGPLAR